MPFDDRGVPTVRIEWAKYGGQRLVAYARDFRVVFRDVAGHLHEYSSPEWREPKEEPIEVVHDDFGRMEWRREDGT